MAAYIGARLQRSKIPPSFSEWYDGPKVAKTDEEIQGVFSKMRMDMEAADQRWMKSEE